MEDTTLRTETSVPKDKYELSKYKYAQKNREHRKKYLLKLRKNKRKAGICVICLTNKATEKMRTCEDCRIRQKWHYAKKNNKIKEMEEKIKKLENGTN